jgi:cold shock CspA family protein
VGARVSAAVNEADVSAGTAAISAAVGAATEAAVADGGVIDGTVVSPASESSASVLADHSKKAVGVTLAFNFVTGRVLRVNDAKRFCFIRPDDAITNHIEEVFCHFDSHLKKDRVVVDECVRFAVVNGVKGPQAAHVTTIDTPRFRYIDSRGGRGRGYSEGDRRFRGGARAPGSRVGQSI